MKSACISVRPRRESSATLPRGARLTVRWRHEQPRERDAASMQIEWRADLAHGVDAERQEHQHLAEPLGWDVGAHCPGALAATRRARDPLDRLALERGI